MVRLWGVALYAAVAFAACAAALPTKQAPNTNFAQDGEIDDAADMEESEPQSWESWVSEPQSWETQTQPWESEPQPWEPEGWEPAAWEPEGWNWRAEPGDLLFSPEDPTKALWPTNRSGAGPWSRPVYPEIIIHWDEVAPLLLELSYERMNRSLLTLTGFFNRYYSTQSGMAASEWVHQMVLDTLLYNPIALSSDVTAVRFEHLWPQSSVIVTIPGQTNDTIVLGAHIDTFLQLDGKKSTKPKMPDEKEVRRPKSLFEDTVLPLEGNVLAGPAPDREDYITWPVRAPHPGADDNASGTAALMEILRVLILHPKIAVETPLNTLEFHFYAAEEAGLRGSFEIFRHYRLGGRSIKAMLNIDTIGWVRPKYRPRIAVLSEGDRTGLSTYLAKCVDAYSFLSPVFTYCGHACSDHISVRRNGFPSTMITESEKRNRNMGIHRGGDKWDKVNLHHAREIAKAALGFAFELAHYRFPSDETIDNPHGEPLDYDDLYESTAPSPDSEA